MDYVQINVKSPVYGFIKLNVDYIIEKNGELNIKLQDTMCYSINPGDKIYFRRTVSRKNRTLTFEEFVIVKREDADHVIYTTLLDNRKTRLYNNFFEFKYSGNTSYHIITCKEPHYLFGQDLEVSQKQVVYFKTFDGELLGSCSGISPLHVYRLNELVKEDCITSLDYDETCGKPYDRVETRHYYFSPECCSENSFILSDFEEIELAKADYIETKFNPYWFDSSFGFNT